MPDLRTTLLDAAAVPPVSDFDEQDVRRRVRDRRRLRRSAGTLLVIAVALAGARLVDGLRPRADVTFAEGAVTQPRWSPLPRAPLSPRFGSFAQWTGSEFIVWGGYAGSGSPTEGTAGDGAAYDPETGRWRKLPGAPIPALYGGASAWTGEELWIVGGIGEPYGRTSLRDAAAYDPQGNTWRLLPEAPVLAGHGVWAGDRFVVLGSREQGAPELWSLRPGAQTWVQWSNPATELPQGVLVAGEDGTVFVVAPDDDSLAIDLGGDAQVLPDRPGHEGRDEVAATWTDGELVVVDDRALGYRDGIWRDLGAPPGSDAPPRLYALDGGRVLALDQADSGPSVLDLDTGTWTTLPQGPLGGMHSAATAVAVDRLFLWGGGSSSNLPAGDGAVLTLPPPAGTPVPDVRLYATSDSTLTIVDLARGTSESRPLPQLAGGDPPFRLAARGDRLVFFGRDGDTFVLEPESGEVRKLGDSAYFLPSASPDRVWLISDEPRRAREVTLDGAVTVPEIELPAARFPVAAVDGGLILSFDNGLERLKAATNEVWRMPSGPIPVAAAGDVVARCEDPCTTLRLSDLRDGDEATVHLPAGEFAAYEGAFSPDGRFLAVPVHPAGLALVDIARNEVRLVPGVTAEHPELVWTPDGQEVLFPAEGGQLGRYRLGAEEAETVPVDLGDAVYGMATVDAR